LLNGKAQYPALGHLIILGLLTGARLDELASLKSSDVSKHRDGYYVVSIKRSKTKAGVRTITVAHPHAATVIKQRMQGQGAGDSLWPELSPGGYDEKLSWAASKAFGRYRDALKLPRAVDFHSLRRTLITLLENLEVDQVRIARYVGHTLPTLAFSLYSGGSSEKTSLEVARTIRYAPAVEEAVHGLLNEG